jgi:5S rRNA maturation endonuclease (ribonuclease M5)
MEKAGETFFHMFFENKGIILEPNEKNEAAVLCPFPHAKGYETRPSAHVNVKKAVFHCAACEAEGNIPENEKGGLSEIGFFKKVLNLPDYGTAASMLAALKHGDRGEEYQEAGWENATTLLWNSPTLIQFLREERGLTDDTIRQLQLASDGSNILYPVFVWGVLQDIRAYNPEYKKTGGTKIRSLQGNGGLTKLLFPFDLWYDRQKAEKEAGEVPISVLCAGENDTALMRQFDFNAITTTCGEASFPEYFLPMFEGHKVYIFYDCDEAGIKSARRVAFKLREAGAQVFVVDLKNAGLTGEKGDNDVSDLVVKHGKSKDVILQLMQDTPEYSDADFKEDRNIIYPLVDLWDAFDPKWRGKYISSNVVMAGKQDYTMEAPCVVEWECYGENPESATCNSCRKRKGEKGQWTLTKDNLEDIVEIVDVEAGKKKSNIRRLCGIPSKCPGSRITPTAFVKVQKVLLTPDVASESLDNFQQTQVQGYVIGHELTDGQRYRVYYRRFAHEEQHQRIMLAIDKSDQSDNPINTFKMTPEIYEQLKVFQGHPKDVMEDRAERVKDIRKEFSPKEVIWITDLMYHTPLEIIFDGAKKRGYLEAIIPGESRTGKTTTARDMMRYYGVGNLMYCKGASEAGLMGGAEQVGGRWMISWGAIPMNHKSLLILDEVSGLGPEKIARLTAVRSEGFVDIKKIVKGKAPAQTRLLWISNPARDGKSRKVSDYNDGVALLMDLIGSDEDVARFDLCYIVTKQKTVRYSEKDITLKAYEPQVYRNLIYWCWTRKAEQVKFDDNVEDYIWVRSEELNDEFDCEGVKLFGVELRFKIARIATAVAGCCFSTDDGETLLVRKEHVDWAIDFMLHCYDNDVFNIRRYVRMQRRYNEADARAIAMATKLCDNAPALVKAILYTDSFTLAELQNMSGISDREQWGKIAQTLSMYDFIKSSGSNGRYNATVRFKKAVKAYNQTIDEKRLRSLEEREGGFL